jgi:hypothetical protein
MSGAIPLLPTYAFIVCVRTNLRRFSFLLNGLIDSSKCVSLYSRMISEKHLKNMEKGVSGLAEEIFGISRRAVIHGGAWQRAVCTLYPVYYPGQYTTSLGSSRPYNLGPLTVSSEVTPRSFRVLPSVRRKLFRTKEPTLNFDVNLGIIIALCLSNLYRSQVPSNTTL